MKTANEIVKVLNNLIEANLARINAYEKAATETTDSEIKNLCSSLSKGFRTQLEQLVREYNGKPFEENITHRHGLGADKETKHPLSDSKKSVLNKCELTENATIESYRHAKTDSLGFPARVVTIILNQNSEIVKARDRIGLFRNVLTAH